MKIRNKIKKNKQFKNIYFTYYFAFLMIFALICVLSAVVLNDTVKYVWYYAGGVFLLLIFVCKKVTDFISTRIYKPIDEIARYFDQNEKDVTFLNRSVKSLITENEQMKERLELNGRYIENNQLRDLVRGNPVYIGDLPENANINVMVGKCFAIYIDCDFGLLKKSDNIDFEVTNLKKDCEEAIKEHLEQKLVGKFVELEDGKYVFISKPVEKAELTMHLLDMIELIEKTYKLSAFVAVGKTVDKISQISKSFLGISNILERRFCMGKTMVFVEDFIQVDGAIYYPHESEMTLVNSVITGNKEAAQECLSSIFEMNFIKRSIDKENLSDLKFAMTATIKRIIRNIGAQTEDIFGEGSVIYLEINSSGTNREFMMSVMKIVEKICDYQTNQTKKKKSRLSNDIKEYVKINYKNNISIVTMSETLFVSQSHINRIMRTEFGSTFKSYLDMVRIDEAKRLLEGTALNINAISDEVGFNSNRTFIRVFKKQVGCLPREYREKQQKNS